ncbi:MAG: hypothetical protein AAGC44_09280 [Planctomycetota bacterium]
MVLIQLHTSATLYMVGLIWFVQLVHYPLMARVGEAQFIAYERLHTRWTTVAVAPAMFVELGTSVALVPMAQGVGYPPVFAWAGLGLVLMLWVSTAILQVPCHRRLEQGFDRAVHQRLVRSNWLRTVGWSLRGVLVLIAMPV